MSLDTYARYFRDDELDPTPPADAGENYIPAVTHRVTVVNPLGTPDLSRDPSVPAPHGTVWWRRRSDYWQGEARRLALVVRDREARACWVRAYAAVVTLVAVVGWWSR